MAEAMTCRYSLAKLTVTLAIVGLGWLASVESVLAADQPAMATGRSVRDLAIQRAEEHIQRGLDLGSRKAVCSAQLQFIKAVRQIAVALDIEQGDHAHQAALDEGVRILAMLDAPRDNDPAGLAAMQQQLLDAQKRLAYAGGNLPQASMALFGAGRSYTALAEELAEERSMAGPKAMTMYQAALTIDGANYMAANELSVLLVGYGQLQDAEQVLTRALEAAQRPELWRNLAVVYDKMGRPTLAAQAQQQYLQMTAGRPQAAASSQLAASVRWTEPGEFNRAAGNDSFDVPVAAKAAGKPKTEIETPKPEEKKESRFLPDWITGKSSGTNTK